MAKIEIAKNPSDRADELIHQILVDIFPARKSLGANSLSDLMVGLYPPGQSNEQLKSVRAAIDKFKGGVVVFLQACETQKEMLRFLGRIETKLSDDTIGTGEDRATLTDLDDMQIANLIKEALTEALLASRATTPKDKDKDKEVLKVITDAADAAKSVGDVQ